jgi:geranylgeranyl transferase type-2 subunit beta
LQVLAILDALGKVDRDRTAAYVASLQRPDGAFMGDEWGEVDTRFVYCALNCLSLLGRLPVLSSPLPPSKVRDHSTHRQRAAGL